MINYFERLKIKLLINLTWKMSKKRMASAIANFSDTEADTVWQLLLGMERTEDPKQRAEIFSQMLEENHHAEEFKKVYKYYSKEIMPSPNHEKAELYDGSEGPWRLFAYCYVGEEEATLRFRHIIASIAEGPLKRVLLSIVQDEMGHIQKADQLLQSIGIPRREILAEIVRIKIKRGWEGWVRTGKKIGQWPIEIFLGLLYYVVGLLYAPLAMRKISEQVPSGNLPL